MKNISYQFEGEMWDEPFIQRTMFLRLEKEFLDWHLLATKTNVFIVLDEK